MLQLTEQSNNLATARTELETEWREVVAECEIASADQHPELERRLHDIELRAAHLLLTEQYRGRGH